ncbi:hypothetical protein [Pseudooceanicola sp. LIPI14-2-Ac024]|uniref:hypothetical protein n=1 Tax=Pseudooceanicola sp. LIPI14-2-Ac024 TaxID=3344875 RepID=UPI0035D00430
MLRLTLAALLCAATALPAAAQDKIENEQMVIYAGQWVQSKLPDQAGALMFLTLPRGQKGEYFTISCSRSGGGMDRTVKLGFPQPLAQDGMPVTLTVDGQPRTATATFTGTTRDDAYTKADIHSYALAFESDAAEEDFFRALSGGNTLQISGKANRSA